MAGTSLVGLEAAAAASPTIVSVVAGWQHTCALTSGGGVLCWGHNDVGQLGDGTIDDRSLPVAVSGLSSGVTKIAAGGKRTCALLANQTVKCWGGNSTGAVGDGTTTDRSVPTAVLQLSGVTDIAAGTFHTCAIVTLASGVRCWGLNDVGQLGNGTTADSPTPVAATMTGAVAVSGGGKATCALTSGGGAKCWGDNASGQGGDGTGVPHSTPTDVSGMSSGVTALAAGGQHTCAMLTGGAVKCFGRNNLGQVGDGSGANQLSPVAVSGLGSGVNAIASGRWHSCALSAGAMKCWGSPQWTFDAPGGPTYPTPVGIAGLASGVTSMAAGEGHTCAVTTSARVECFGGNSNGQLGNGSVTDSPTPVLVRFAGQVLAASDFDGSGRTDVAVFRPGSGTWFVQGGPATSWGTSGDIPVAADYDGDGKADIAVFRPSDGVWYEQRSGGGDSVVAFGASGDVPVPADYDGDGKADIAVFRPSNGVWYQSLSGGTTPAVAFGASGDVPAPADYDGDGKADIAVFRPSSGVWYQSLSGGTTPAVAFGTSGDVPVPADYDGDGDADVAVFRAESGTWFVRGGITTAWGTTGDRPAPARPSAAP